MKIKKIIVVIVVLFIFDLIKIPIHNYGFNNIGNYGVLVMTYVLSMMLSIISVAVIYKLFSKIKVK